MQMPTPPSTPACGGDRAKSHVQSVIGIEDFCRTTGWSYTSSPSTKSSGSSRTNIARARSISSLRSSRRCGLRSSLATTRRTFSCCFALPISSARSSSVWSSPATRCMPSSRSCWIPRLPSASSRLGASPYEKFFQAMGSLLPKLCAPVRDEEVKQLVEEKLQQGNYVDRIEALMGFIDVMLSDYANYLLQLAAPQIISSATTYEAKIFANAIDAGTCDLSKATAAWREARAKVHSGSRPS